MVFGVRRWRASLRLGLVAALVGVVVLRSLILPNVGTVLSGLVLLLAFAVALRSPRAFVPETILSALVNVAKIPTRLTSMTLGVRRYTRSTKIRSSLVLPIVVPMGLCLVFAGVFALANPVIAQAVAMGWRFLERFVALPSIGRSLLWAVAAIGALALIRPAMRLARTGNSEVLAEQPDATITSLGIARNALIGLNVLFLAYNALDAACLWAGAPPAGTKTQQYAHEGAFWLTVALLLLTFVVGVLFRGSLARDARARFARHLAYAWVAQGLVLSIGTYRRIAIHIAHSGLSDLRIVGILGTTSVLVGVLLVAAKLRGLHTFRWLLRRQLDAFAVIVVLHAVVPTNAISAKVNVGRIAAGEYRPLLHIFADARSTESADAVSALLSHPDVRIRQGIAALVVDEHELLRAELSARSSWRARDGMTRRTLASLAATIPLAREVLGQTDPAAARRVLLEISRVAGEDRSLEEILAVPAADYSARSYEVLRR